MLYFVGLTLGWLSAGAPPRAGGARAGAARMAAAPGALIIQNKGGGHGEIGYHLALQLAKERGLGVTILHEGPPAASKPPHSAYGDLEAAGVTVHWCDDLADSAACIAKLDGVAFGSVVDNWSKSPEQIRPYAELAKGWGVSNYAYVSSAGMYTPTAGDFSPITEDCAVKSSGQRQAEELLAELGLPFSYFRPQYIYGPKQGKSYLAYFFDRLTRGRPVPVPGAGDQQVTMTHAADNAAMIAAAVGCEAAVGQTFNCATGDLITYDALVRECARAAGVEADIAHYAPGTKAEGFKFPFRETPFFVDVGNARARLGFKEANTIAADIEWYYAQNYKATGAEEKELDFAADDALLAQ